MGSIDLKEELNEKAFEIILSFKPSDKYDKAASKEILKIKENILKLISGLSKIEQDILELRFSQNLSKNKIAEKIGKDLDYVSKTISKSLNSIRGRINNPEFFAEKISKIINFPNANPFESKPGKDKLKKVNVENKKNLTWIVIWAFLVLLLVFFIKSFPLDEIKNFLVGRSSVGTFSVKQRKVNNAPNKIKISGSTSLSSLARRLENAFSVAFPAYSISLAVSDSDEGINSLIKGESDIANSSRPLSFDDRNKAKEYGIELSENRVALDALVLIANKSNPIEEISVDDIRQIFRGEVNNWEDLLKSSRRSNFKAQILPIAREAGSGTNEFFKSRILEWEEFNSFVNRKSSNKEIFNFVAENNGAVGFINSTNYPWSNLNIKYLKIKNYPDSQAYSPFDGNNLNEVAIRYGDYPLAHYLYLVTLSNCSNGVEQFISWVLGKDGQEIVRHSGLIPVYDES